MADEFEIYLGKSYGRWNGKEPARPKSARVIAMLGHTLERAERDQNALVDGCWKPGDPDGDMPIGPERAAIIAREDEILARYRVALNAYIDAVNARDLWERVKLIRRKKTPSAADALPLQVAQYAARQRSNVLHDLGPAFSTRRERIDADLAASQAESFFAISQAKYQAAERLERRTGIRKHSRSRMRLVTDGYVTTGKYKMINGTRVSVLEKVPT